MGKLVKRLFGLCVIAGVAGFLAAVGYALWVARDLPSPEAFANRKITESTKIYDRSGTALLYEIRGEERRSVIAREEIPEVMKQAIVTVEDERFFSHRGVDPEAIVRSLVANLTHRRIAQGGSTITQQLIRNTIITKERTFARKIREVILAIELEVRYSKDELLGFYLNAVPFGENTYGVEAASRAYFGKAAKDLSLNEAATMAALPKAPTYYSPYGNHKEDLLARKDGILARMRDRGYGAAEAHEEAKGNLPVFQPPNKGDIKTPHFVMFVKEYLEKTYGKERIEQDGFKVLTTLDWDLQQLAEKVVAEGAAKNEKKWKARNAALVAVDPQSGQILAMVGSRDYFDVANDGNVNVAVRPRQPGSAFKPFAYAAAFKKGYTPDTIIFDLPTEFAVTGAKSYKPQNYNGQTRGPVSMREALANSLNIPAVKTLYLAGINETIELAHAAGITTLQDRERYGLALVLGGGEVKLLDMTAAFAVFARDGERNPATAIREIRDGKDELIEEFATKPEQAVDANVARMITDVLTDNAARTAIFGAKSPLVVPGFAVAAKTGTTEDFRDGWTVGYSPSLAAGVWVGNNDNSEMKKGADGVNIAAPLWNAFMKEALPRFEKTAFTKPKITKTGKPMLDGSYLIEERVKIDKASGKKVTSATPPEFIEEKIFRSVHSILFWANRTAPLGPQPKKPEQDPQFAAWEKGIQEWLTQHPEILAAAEIPPDVFDDVHKEEYRPAITIAAPMQQEILTSGKPFTVTFSVEATFPLQRALLFADDEIIKSADLPAQKNVDAYTLTAILSNPEETNQIFREKTLTVRVFDVYGNGGGTSVAVRFIPR